MCSLFSCGWLNHRLEKKIDGLVLEWCIPMADTETGEINTLIDSCLMYYKDDLIMLRIPYSFTQYNQTKQKSDTTFIVEGPNDFEEIRFKNFIYEKNSFKGLCYDSISVKKNTVFNVDSLLKKKTFNSAKFYDRSNDVLIEHKQDRKTGLVFEKYIPKVKFDESYNDTTYFIFDPKFKLTNYSLSKEADNLKKMKLVAVKLSYNPKLGTVNNPVPIPKRTFSFKIRELKMNNKREISDLFERFKKDNKQLNLN